MPHSTNRRRFLQTTAASGIGFWVAAGATAQPSKSPNEQVAIACIGIGGRGSNDSDDASRHGRVVAICDVDDGTRNAGEKRFPGAKRYKDFRKLLDEMGKSIDAVTVATPDHTHAPAALMAMRMGKHCFCEKPLTHTIYEARLMAKVAREMKVATQMGNQGTASSALRKAAAIIKKGTLGSVKEVHVWTNRPIWAQGGNRPESAPCPGVDWNLWLGSAPVRPSAKRGTYHAFAWRGWWDFGTGALGDMACHTVNMPYMALNLRDPVAIQADCSGHNGDSYPKWSTITFDYPELNGRAPVKLFWYDGGKRPDKHLLDGKKMQASGCLVIGDKGKLYSPGDYAENAVLLFGGATMPDDKDIKYTESPGHFQEWIRAIKGGEPAMSNFPDYAGGLTETILLGNLAVWVAATGEAVKDPKSENARPERYLGQKVEWDAKNMRSPNIAGLETIIKPLYRPGYTLDV